VSPITPENDVHGIPRKAGEPSATRQALRKRF